MFSYYGSKSKIVHLYPAPKHDLIIEPFAGSARYALKYFDRDVLLSDKYQTIIDVWKYLQNASEKDILGLPDIKIGQSLKDFQFLTKEERNLIGFIINRGSAQPKNQASYCDWNRDRQSIAEQLFKIRHWQIQLNEYTNAPDVEATWFIDPPYFKGGEHYVHSTKQINFNEVSDFAKRRKGQVIVCENTAADWMPFMRLAKMSGAMKTTTEVFWTNEKVEFQANLF